jgi:hypothetical protein
MARSPNLRFESSSFLIAQLVLLAQNTKPISVEADHQTISFKFIQIENSTYVDPAQNTFHPGINERFMGYRKDNLHN